jgi:HK97 family phage portal protein
MAKSLIGKVLNARPPQRPIPFNDRWNTQSGQLFGSGLQDRFTQLNAMGSQGTLFAVIQLLSTGAQAMGGWKLFRKNEDGRVRYTTADRGSDQRQEVLRHAALKLWNQPNPFMTGAEFREIGWQYLELVGEWYWVLNRGASGKQVPTEIWPVRPDKMQPVPHPKNFLAGWVYTAPNGEQVPLLHSEVIQIKYPNPLDIYRGLSAVQALLADIDAAKYTAEWSRNFFLNSATPGGIVQFQKRLTDKEFDEFVARWREQHQGVARGHRVGVLEQGAVWVPNTYTLRDMQFVELRQLSGNNIREAYRIHPSMLGMVEDVNRANAETAEEVHIRWHEVTRLNRLKMVANMKYLDLFANTGVEFDYDDPSPASADDANEELTTKSTSVQKLVEAGFDPDDACEVVGLPKMRYVGPPAPAGGAFGQPALGGSAGQSALPAGPSGGKPTRRSVYEGVEGDDSGNHSDTNRWSANSIDFDFAGMLRESVHSAILNKIGEPV